MNATAQTSRKVVPTTDAVVASMLALGEFQIKPTSRNECAVWRHETQLDPLDIEMWIREAYPTLRDFHELIAGRDWVTHLSEEVECELRLSPIKHGFSVEAV